MEPFPDSLSGGRGLGPDKVLYYGDSVIVYASREMPDWQMREFCRIPIYFEQRKFFIKRKARMQPPYVVGYELEPWPEDLHEESKLAIHYDADYVAQRERTALTDERDQLGRLLLLPFFPFLGFLWSDFKERRLERFGLNPTRLTKASLPLGFFVIVLELVFYFLGHAGFLETLLGPGAVWLDFTLLAVFAVDTPVRSAWILREVDSPPGFLEWLLKRKRPAQFD